MVYTVRNPPLRSRNVTIDVLLSFNFCVLFLFNCLSIFLPRSARWYINRLLILLYLAETEIHWIKDDIKLFYKGTSIATVRDQYTTYAIFPAPFGYHYLKGQHHEIFDLRVFAWISFPQGLEYHIKYISHFFENSWRYWQLKMHHRCRWHGGKWKNLQSDIFLII